MFLLAQMMLVLFISVNSFMMVVKEKRLSIGTRDWKLLVVSFGVPTVLAVVLNALDFIGPGPHSLW